MEIRTRFAPSPTGYMHLGNVWIAFLNWWWTRQHRGKIVLRIEDIDQLRCHEKYISAIQEDLTWLGLDWDEGPEDVYAYGPLQQSHRYEIYKAIQKKWEKEYLLYPCFCSRARIHKVSSAPHLGEETLIYDGHCRNLSESIQRTIKKIPSWRVKIDEEKISFNDMFCGSQIKVLKAISDDFVVFRADGAVAYQLAAAADDGTMGITHVFRGNDLLPSTFYQIYLLKKLKYPVPTYGHLPLLVDKTGVRLSKRQHGITVKELREAGVSAEQIIGQFLFWLGALKKPMPLSAETALTDILFSSCTYVCNPVVRIDTI